MELVGEVLVFGLLVAFPVVTLVLRLQRNRRRLGVLRAFARRLGDPRQVDVRGGLLVRPTSWSVRGRLDGRPVDLSFVARGGGRHSRPRYYAVLQVAIRRPVRGFTLGRPGGALGGLGRWLGVTDRPGPDDERFVIQKAHDRAELRGLLATRAVRQAADRVLAIVPEVTLSGRRLQVTVRIEEVVHGKTLERAYHALCRVAALCERPKEAPPEVEVPARPRPADPEGEVRCHVCRGLVVPTSGDRFAPRTCDGCGTDYHAGCYEETGGCAVDGCRPAPEPAPARVHLRSPADT